MTQEEKELLLKDLSARLSYNVALNCKDEDCNFTCYLTTAIFTDIQSNNPHYEYRPYLFPLSSVTEKQKEELDNLHCGFDTVGIHNFIESFTGPYREFVSHSDCIELIDWLNKNYFDYRGLIPMGLALDATGLNIY